MSCTWVSWSWLWNLWMRSLSSSLSSEVMLRPDTLPVVSVTTAAMGRRTTHEYKLICLFMCVCVSETEERLSDCVCVCEYVRPVNE